MNTEQFEAGTAPFEDELRDFLLKYADLPPAEIMQLEAPVRKRSLVPRYKK